MSEIMEERFETIEGDTRFWSGGMLEDKPCRGNMYQMCIRQ